MRTYLHVDAYLYLICMHTNIHAYERSCTHAHMYARTWLGVRVRVGARVRVRVSVGLQPVCGEDACCSM